MLSHEDETRRLKNMESIREGLQFHSGTFLANFRIGKDPGMAFILVQELLYQTSGENGFRDAPWNDPEKIALMHSEVSEAWAALASNDAMDDHLPGVHGVVAEAADTVIRIMDFSQHHGVDLTNAILVSDVDTDGMRPDEIILDIHKAISDALEALRKGRSWREPLARAVVLCLHLCEPYAVFEETLGAVILQKAIFNTTRPYKHGKAF